MGLSFHFWQEIRCFFLLPSLTCLLHANNGILEILTCQFWKIKLANFGYSKLPILEIQTCQFWKFKLANSNLPILEVQTCQFWKFKLANFGNSNLPILVIINLLTLDIMKLANFGNYRTCPFWIFYKLTFIILPTLVAIKASSFETPN